MNVASNTPPSNGQTYEQALRQVAKLLKLAEHANTSPEEAATAAAKAQELMTRHKIERLMAEDASTAKAEPEEDIVDFADRGAHLDVLGQNAPRWKTWLAVILAKANQCKAYTSRKSVGQKTIELVGRPSDAETVRYMYAYLLKECDRLTRIHGKGCGRVWCNNFRLGVVEAISLKLKAARTEMVDAMKAEIGRSIGSTALVRVDRALEKLDKRSASVEVFTKQKLKLVKVGGGSIRLDPSAREAGRQAGSSISVGTRGPKLTAGLKSLKG